jgi:cobalt-zinc-cadmium efflux system outer membrane protein
LAAQARRQRQEHAHTLAKYENAPDFTVGFRYTRIGEGVISNADAGQDAWMIPVKITLPIWQNRIASTIAEARKSLQSSRAQVEQVENLTDYEVRNTYYQFLQQKQTVELYRNTLLPQALLAFESDQAAYEAGQVDILNLIDSQRVYLNAKIVYYETLGSALKSLAAIEWIVGVDLEEQFQQVKKEVSSDEN